MCIYTCTFLIQVCIKGGSKHSAAALREVTEKLEKTNIDLGKAIKAAWVVHGRAEVVTIVILWLLASRISGKCLLWLLPL